ncbi:leucyl-cystinyl aminopeptidase-like [Polymixia lowei]
MVLVRLLALSVFCSAVIWSQPTQSPRQASSLPHPTEDASPPGAGSLSFPWSRLRLPRYITPLHYDLLLHPNLTALRFTGSVQIQIHVQNNTNWVVLHSKGLQISKATVLDQNLAHLSDQVLPVLHNPAHEQAAIFSPRVLVGGQKYFLYIEFGAELAEGFYGFYRSTYRTSTGETRTLASTHFEPTSARMAFPCFDEPSFKANYSIRIRRSPVHIALSNMPIEKTVEVSEGLLEDQFAVSVKMSTYLVAFVICDFKSVTATTSSGVQVSIYASPEKWQQTHYALDVAVKMLDFYEKYFNIFYPLPKQDLIAIPDFQSGAMENWGLTTYRETSLLYDPLTSSSTDKLWVTMVIGHELAHQWFGNLVTMEWWNDIWLNEGFARYMEYISVEATYPEFRVEDYLLGTCFAAVGRDSLNSSRPISSPAESPTQIKEMFDTVSYNKGACVLHMLRHFLTDEVFQSGIVRYLRKYSYGNAKNQDLWDSLANTCSEEDFTSGSHCYSSSQASKNAYLFAGEHLDLTAMMNTWTLQKGVPLVTVTRKGSRLLLRQERFLKTILPSDPLWPTLQKGYLWQIPLTYKTDTSSVVQRHLMSTHTDSVHVGEEVGWVKVNTDMAGYYLVHYEGSGWDELTKLLRENHTALSYRDRTHLIHNAFQLVTAGKLSLDKALDLIGYLSMETHTVPLLEGLGYLEAFYRMVEKRNVPDITHKLRKYILRFFSNVINQQTWSDHGSVSERRLRSEVLSLACHLDDPPCVQRANQSFRDWLDSNATLNLPTDVAETVFSVGAQDEHGWASLLHTYTISFSETHKDKILSALASSRDINKLHRLLELGLEGEVIRSQDLSSLILMVARNPRGHHLAWNYVKKNWGSLVYKFQLGSFCIRNIIIGTTGQFSSPEDLTEVKLFFQSIKEQASQLTATQIALDNVQKNVLWVQRNLETLRNWLNEQMKLVGLAYYGVSETPAISPPFRNMDPFDSNNSERANLPRNMIENSMFEEEPDVVDLAKDSTAFPTFPALDPDEVVYEPRSSRLLVRGLGENELDEEEEDYESSARLLGMSFMNRSSAHRASSSPYIRQAPPSSCSRPSARTMVVCVLFLVIVASMTMVLYFLPGCTFTKTGCPKPNNTTPIEPLNPNSTSGEPFPWNEFRLPASVRPLEYHLTLNPDLKNMTFTGCTVITMSVLHNTKRIVLHGAELNITKATFQLGDGKPSDVTVLEYKPRQQIAIKFSDELKAGQHCVLTLNYSANLSHTYDGFYNSSYIDKDGNKRVLAATQFEPLAARKAFPCFDEPAFKASFLVKISRESGYIALSNMPKAKTTPLSNGLLLDEFEKSSVKMSTYLVAFVVANFTYVSRNVSNTLVSVYSVPEKKEHTFYALDTASKLLQYYNTFFDVKYSLSKLDLVAIPDFLAGAMENWGLITFRETSLLVGNQSSPLEKQLVASVVAHELAHQWFGNLVTMRWWNDLWLNEGFATYMQYTSLQSEFPQLDIGNLFLAVRFGALAKDALNSSHAVSVQVNTSEQVAEMFDFVSYEKGASILLMLNSSLPREQFRKGIIEYLNRFNGSNTVTDDLWNSLTQAEVPPQHQSVAEMMRTWTLEKGFPLVTVSVNKGLVTFTQEHFLLTADNTTHPSSLWHIPVTYVNDSCSSAPECRQFFTLKTKSDTLKLADHVKWLKLNYKNTGFYIVHYGDEGWLALTSALTNNVNVLTCEDRASLIHNIFALSRLGRVSFNQVFNLLKYITKETETAPLTQALLQLNTIYRLLDKRQEQILVARMRSYILDHFGALMDNQTWGEEESVSKQELRSALLEVACSLDRQNCIQHAQTLYKQYTDSNGTMQIPGDLQRAVFSVAAQSEEGWLTLLQAYRHTTFDAEKRNILHALASTQDTKHIVWILRAGLEGELIQTQELPLVISTVSDGFAGHLFAWDFVQENWDRLIEKFPVGSFVIQSIIKSTTSQFSTQAHLDQVQGFFSSLKERGSQMRSVQEALETIRLNQRWMDTNLPTLREWL